MAIPEHNECVKMKQMIRDIVKKEKNYYALITNRNERLKYPAFRKLKMRKRTIWFALRDHIQQSRSKFKAKKYVYKRLIDYYKALFGPYYRKWGKYKS